MKKIRRKIASILTLVIVLQSCFTSFGAVFPSFDVLSQGSALAQDEVSDAASPSIPLLAGAAPTQISGFIDDYALHFYSKFDFTLSAYQDAQNKPAWKQKEEGENGTLYYDVGKEWDGSVVSAYYDSTNETYPYHIYISGENNTMIAGIDENYVERSWTLKPTDVTAPESTEIYCEGDVAKLLGSDKKMDPYCFAAMFLDCSYLATAPELSISELSEFCYASMFEGCTNLLCTPSLNATTLNTSCYAYMFAGCTNLQSASILPATKLMPYCYQAMFAKCEQLSVPPTIGDTEHRSTIELAESCCEQMFIESGVEFMPKINATKMEKNCYKEMFMTCKKLVKPCDISATSLAASCFSGMFHHSAISITYSTKEKVDGHYLKPWIIADKETVESEPEPAKWSSGMLSDTKGYKTNPSIENLNYYYISDPSMNVSINFENENDDSDSAPWGYVKVNGEEKTEFTSFYKSAISLSEDKTTLTFTSTLESDPIVYAIATPSGPETYKYDYFAAWDETDLPAYVDDDMSIKAVFSRILRSFKLAFEVNDNNYGSILIDSEDKKSISTFYGSEGVIDNDRITLTTTEPENKTVSIQAVPKESTTKVYTFSKWVDNKGNELTSPFTVTEDMQIIAVFEESVHYYTVTWNNYDGKTLKTETVAYGILPSYDGDTPVKPSTEQHTYTFSGWTPEVVAVTGDATYTATFTETENLYTVTWKNEDGTVLHEDKNLPIGTRIVYDGPVPSKAGDDKHSYYFAGWSPALTPDATVTGDMVFTATFTEERLYSVIWKNDDGTVLETDSGIHSGTVPAYHGAEPAKAADDKYIYTFAGWNPAISPVVDDVIYTAVYSSAKKLYTVSFSANGHGTAPDPVSVAWDELVPVQADPVAEGYTFQGWYLGEDYTKAQKWEFDSMKMPVSDITLYAGWLENEKPKPQPQPEPDPEPASSGSTTTVSTIVAYSDCLVMDQDGNWLCINKKTGEAVANAWVCDDAPDGNGQSVWYLTDEKGYIIAAPLVRDASGNYFSIETSHNGSYGCMRHVNGTYDGIYMEFSQNHDGTFGAITNQSAIDALNALHGTMQLGFGNEACTYTTTFYN